MIPILYVNLRLYLFFKHNVLVLIEYHPFFPGLACFKPSTKRWYYTHVTKIQWTFRLGVALFVL